MKYILFLLCLCLLSCSTSKRSLWENRTILKTEVTDPYLDAINQFAQASPIIGGDEESYWAAHEVDSMTQIYKQKPFNFYEQMAFSNYSQKVITYGIAYFTAIVGTYRDRGLSDTLLTIAPEARKTLKKLTKENFSNYKNLSDDFLQASERSNDFFSLYYATNREDPFQAGNHWQCIYWHKRLVEQIYESIPDSLQAYRMSVILENTTFFITYCQMYNVFNNEELYYKNQEQINEMANWFDEQTIPLKVAVIKKEPDLERFYMDDDQFMTFIKKSTDYRIKLLEFLTEAIRSREKK